MKWTEKETKQIVGLLKKYPSYTYNEIIKIAGSKRTLKSLIQKNAKEWKVSRCVKNKEHLNQLHKTGKDSHSWKGGRVRHAKGYICCYAPNHPRTNSKYVFEHILVAEKKIGRFLKNDEVVHHIDGVKDNNRPDNLLVLSRSEHTLIRHPSSLQVKNGWLRGRKYSINSISKKIADELPKEFYYKIKDNKLIIDMDNYI